MRRVVLDTNAYSGLISGDQAILAVLNEAEEVLLPIFVLAELYYGFRLGSKEQANLNLLERFEQKSSVRRLYTTDETAIIFGEISVDLRKSGKPIPTNDIWIAACAIENGSTIVTYDKHFLNIQKARVWSNLSS